MVEFEICAEMQKLRNYLNENNIPWEDGSEDKPTFWMCRTRFDIGDRNMTPVEAMLKVLSSDRYESIKVEV